MSTRTTGQKPVLSKSVKIFDSGYRGNCPLENMEQITAINAIRELYPTVIHPRNEGKRSFKKALWEKAEGLTAGASDIIIPGNPSFVCELKRKDKTKTSLSDDQVDYLNNSLELGCFCCVAYGWEQVIEALKEWQSHLNK